MTNDNDLELNKEARRKMKPCAIAMITLASIVGIAVLVIMTAAIMQAAGILPKRDGFLGIIGSKINAIPESEGHSIIIATDPVQPAAIYSPWLEDIKRSSKEAKEREMEERAKNGGVAPNCLMKMTREKREEAEGTPKTGTFRKLKAT